MTGVQTCALPIYSTEGVDTDQTTGLKEHTEGNEEVERKIQEYTSREESHHE